MTTYERYCHLRDNKKVKDSDVSRGTGIGKSTFSDWKSGRSVPKPEKLQKIADYFDVSVDYLLNNDERYIHIPIDMMNVIRDSMDMDNSILIENIAENQDTYGLSKRAKKIISLLSNAPDNVLRDIENFAEFQLNKYQNNPSDNQEDNHKSPQPGIYVVQKKK